MARRFFKKKPVAGQALPAGFIEGINGMAEALETLDCFGGRVDWHFNRPTIIPGVLTDSGSTALPFRVRVGEGSASAYMEAYYPQAGIVRMNGRTVLGFSSSINTGYIHTTQAHSNASGWVVVRIISGTTDVPDPWNTDSGTEYITGEIAYLSSLPNPTNSDAEFWRQNFPIARCVYSGGAWTITQLHEGAITFNGWGSDSMRAVMDSSGTHEYRSITPLTGYHGALGIEGFREPSMIATEDIPPTEESGIGISFMMRYIDGSGASVKYFNSTNLTALIEALYNFDAKFAEAFADALHNNLSGIQGVGTYTDGLYDKAYHVDEPQVVGSGLSAATAGASYTTTEKDMLQAAYDRIITLETALRTHGLLIDSAP